MQRNANVPSAPQVEQTADTGAVAEATLPAERFDLLVRVTLSTFVENAAWLRTAFTQRGWHCEPDTTVGPEVMGPAEQALDSHWLVDVPVAGSRAGAENEALLRVLRAVKPSGRLVNIRGAWALSPNGVSALEYRVYEQSPPGRSRVVQWIDGLETWTGLRDTGEVVRAYSDHHADNELRRRSQMRNGPERPERWGLRRSAFSPRDLPHPRQSLYPIRKSEADVVRLAVAVCFEALCVVAATPWWRHHFLGVVALVLFSVLYVVPLLPLTARALPHSSRRASLWQGSFGSALGALLGTLMGLYRRQAGPLDTLMLAAVITVGFGLYHLVRTGSIGKALLWVTPVLISLAPPLTEQIGGLSYWTYLYHFGMGPKDVDLPALAQMQPMGQPLMAGIGACLLTAGVVGLFKRFHIDLGWAFLIPFLVIYSLVVVVVALNDGQRAGDKAVRQATALRLPGDFHGIGPEAVCVYPVGGTLPIHGAVLPARTPMLTFDSEASQVALWNPRTSQVTRVPGSEVSLISAAGLSGKCPSIPAKPGHP